MGIAEIIMGIIGGIVNSGISIDQYTRSMHATKNANFYSKQLALLQMLREDNAVQRRVKDLQKAGLSPTLAAGSAAQSSQGIPIKPFQHDLDLQSSMMSGLNMANAVAQIKLANKQSESIDINNKMNLERLPEQIKLLNAQAFKNTEDAWAQHYSNMITSGTGMDTKSGIAGNLLRSLTQWGQNLVNSGKRDLPGYGEMVKHTGSDILEAGKGYFKQQWPFNLFKIMK